MKRKHELRLCGILGLTGILLFGVFSLLHPFTFNPWDTANALKKVSHHHFWVVDHVFILIAITLWLLAMAAGKNFIRNQGILPTVGSHAFVLSLGIWLIILTFEIGVVPSLVRANEIHQNTSLMTTWFVVFCFGLLAGYFAFIFTWLGVLLYSLALKHFPSWFRLLGIWGGMAGIAGIIVGLIFVNDIVVIVGMTSLFPVIWTMLFFWMMITRKSTFYQTNKG